MTTLAAFSEDLSAAVAAAAERVVRLDSGGGRSLSGVIWEEGWIVTAEECLALEERAALTLPDGATAEAELAGRDPSSDVALLRAETGPVDWTAAPMPVLGSVALAVGRGAEGPLASFGIIGEAGPAWTSAAGGRIDARLGLSFRMSHRIEGGVAVDAQGRLIGLAVADPWRRGLVIPVATVARAVERIKEKGYVGRGYLGLGLRPLRGRQVGLIVLDVPEGSPAEAAGVLVGDVLTRWESEPIGSLQALSRRLGPDAIGQTVRVGVLRGGTETELTLTVGERGATRRDG